MSYVYEALRRAEPNKTFEFAKDPDVAETRPQSPTTIDWDAVTELRYSIRSDTRLPVLQDRTSLGAEKFTSLATRLRHLRAERPFKTLLVTSTGPEEGKSFVSANLALALAFDPLQKVLLMEGDIRKPSLLHSFGLFRLPGIVDHVQSQENITRFIYKLQDPKLFLLPAGGRTDTPIESLRSSKLDDCMQELANCFDWIIVDSPPILPIADANLWSQRCDAILLVVREGKSSTHDLKKALEGLDNDNIVALVLNECSKTTHKYSYQYRY